MKNAGFSALLTKSMMVLLLVLPAIPAVAISDDGNLKNLLKKQYKKQILALRSPLQKEDLEFDSDGKPLKAGTEGAWTIHGAIQVEKFSLEPGKLSFEGPWVGFESYKPNQMPSKPIPLGKPIKVEIRLEHALASVQEAETILNRVFLLGRDAWEHWLPECRRSGFMDEAPVTTLGSDGKSNDQDKTTPPVVTYMSDPEFSDEARAARFQGTVVMDVIIDKRGSASKITVTRAIGMGLDLKAMESVSHWKFQPATRKGQPIAAKASMEVSFRMGGSPY
jgi:TonB family protein